MLVRASFAAVIVSSVAAAHCCCLPPCSLRLLALLQNDLVFLRVRSKKHEIMIAPDREYVLVVIQNPAAGEDGAGAGGAGGL